ncbi:hypothetical protein IAQ61_002049 [Plenodomus lingam]|uniref:uncharacterized protein n=1 Tax=Leptosphaeria maculans TaxID=5022 RepID=UPI0033274487|nr:hypothetical protein IAQ61_002049 [Plenodomus lingam]
MGLEWETQRLGDAGVIEGKMQVCPVRSFVTSSKWDFHGQGGWSMKGTCSARLWCRQLPGPIWRFLAPSLRPGNLLRNTYLVRMTLYTAPRRQHSPPFFAGWVDAIVAHVVLAYRVIGLENDANR